MSAVPNAGAVSAPKAVIFDLDGTLIDSACAIAAIGDAMMRELGLDPLDEAEARRYIGNGAAKFVERALLARGQEAAGEALERHVARFQQLYVEAPGEANPPYPGADRLLKILAGAGVRLGLCTNKPGAPSLHVLDALGWRDLFGAIVAGDTLPERKPDPAPLRYCARLLGADIAAGEVVYIGDSEVDAETAEAAQAPFLLHALGYRKTPVERLRCDAAFADFAEVPALLARYKPAA